MPSSGAVLEPCLTLGKQSMLAAIIIIIVIISVGDIVQDSLERTATSGLEEEMLLYWFLRRQTHTQTWSQSSCEVGP